MSASTLQPCPVGHSGFHTPENSNSDRCRHCGAYGVERQRETHTFIVPGSNERAIEVPLMQINSLTALFKAARGVGAGDEESTTTQASAEAWLLTFLGSIREEMEDFIDITDVLVKLPRSTAEEVAEAINVGLDGER